MRRRAMIGGVVASAGVIIVGLQVGAGVGVAHTTTTIPAASPHSGDDSSDDGTASSAGSANATTGAAVAPSPAAASSGSGTAKSGTFTGTTVQTDYGPMQVAAVISGGKISDVTVLQSTNQGGLSVQISNQADPMLRREVLQAQSAKVSTIGGGTYTSEGYLQSLQSALDKAGFAG